MLQGRGRSRTHPREVRVPQRRASVAGAQRTVLKGLDSSGARFFPSHFRRAGAIVVGRARDEKAVLRLELLAASVPADAQDPKKLVPGAAHPGVDRSVNRAIQAGVEYQDLRFAGPQPPRTPMSSSC